MPAGPNGRGKSSRFDAFRTYYGLKASKGWANDQAYYDRPGTVSRAVHEDLSARIKLVFNVDIDAKPDVPWRNSFTTEASGMLCMG